MKWLDGSSGLVAGRLFASAVNAVWLAFLAQQLDLSAFAGLVVILSIAAVATSITEGGLQFAVMEHTARVGSIDLGAIRAALRRREIFMVGVSPAVLLLIVVLMPSRDVVAAALIIPSILATPVYQMVLSGRRGIGRLGAEALNEGLSRSFVVAVGVAVVLSGGGLRAVVLVYSLADVLSALVIWDRARRRWDTGVRVPLDVRMASTRALAGVTIVGSLLQRVDVVLLAAIGAPADVARLGVLSRINDTLQLPAQGVAAVTVHHATRAADDQPAVLRRLLTRSVAATAVLVTLVLVFAEPILRIAFGDAYAPAAGALRIFALAALPAAVVAILLPTVALRSRSAAFVCQALTLGLVVVGDLLLIPHLGLGGVAATALLAQLMAAVLYASRARGPSVGPHVEVGSC